VCFFSARFLIAALEVLVPTAQPSKAHGMVMYVHTHMDIYSSVCIDLHAYCPRACPNGVGLTVNYIHTVHMTTERPAAYASVCNCEAADVSFANLLCFSCRL